MNGRLEVLRSVALETTVKGIHIVVGKRELTLYVDGGGLVIAVSGTQEQWSARLIREDAEEAVNALGAMLDGE